MKRKDDRMDIDELMDMLEKNPEKRREIERRLQRSSYRLTISLPMWMADRIKSVAKKLGCPLTEVIRLALEDYMMGDDESVE